MAPKHPPASATYFGTRTGGRRWLRVRQCAVPKGAAREYYQARLAKLEYEERKGMLLRKDEVEMDTFTMCRVFRDRMLNIPDRISAMLAAETNAARCYEILDAETREALTGVADSLSEGGRRSGGDRESTVGPVS